MEPAILGEQSAEEQRDGGRREIMERKVQDAQEMALQLQDERGSKLYKTKLTYGEVADALKKENLQAAIAAQRSILQAAQDRGRVDLNNADEVRAQAMEYMAACEIAGVFPTMLSFAASLGISRQRLYAYKTQHPHSETTQLLDQLGSAWASIIAQMSLNRQADNATSIFLLKNSGQGLTDKLQVEPVQPERSTVISRERAEEIAARYATLEEVDAQDTVD